MKTLKIDDKWSVTYDPENYDRPEQLLRNGERSNNMMSWNVSAVAMFHALLERDEQIKKLGDMIHSRDNTINTIAEMRRR